MFCAPQLVSRSVSELLLPPRRIAPREAVRRYLRSEKGAWDESLAAAQLEPLDLLASRRYEGIVYLGPSRGSKTFTLVLGGVTYIVTCAPGDTQITHISQPKAKEMSQTDLDRAIEASPELAARLSPRPRDDATFDKHFRSGMHLHIAWPTASQHSGQTLKYILLTDYDNRSHGDNVDNRGALWDLAIARIRTFGSRGKCLAEGSPGSTYADPNWKRSSPHEAPPATGLASIYNLGTRARMYWKCLACGEFFQAHPGLESFAIPEFEEIEQEVQRRDLSWLADQWARVHCESCGSEHRSHHRPELLKSQAWVHEGERIRPDRVIEGERRATRIASYWQGGVSATYQRWESMLLAFLQAVYKYVRTGDEGSLQTTTNTDQASPYLPRSIAKRRTSDHLQQRADSWEQGIVPAGVRFLTAAADVQGNRFVVQVEGWGVGLECWIVDRYELTASDRKEGDKFAALAPSAYEEDWKVLEGAIFSKRYRVDGVENGYLWPLMTWCDSGGKKGATTNAYKFWRGLRDRGRGKRLMLCKGIGSKGMVSRSAPRAVMAWPDQRGRKDRPAGAAGDVPVWELNTNMIKDGIAGDLARELPGPGYVHIPDWLPPSFFDELTAETRKADGWVLSPGASNEALDLHVYNRGICIAIKAEAIDWNRPPEWAGPLATRRFVEPSESMPRRGRRMRSHGLPNR